MIHADYPKRFRQKLRYIPFTYNFAKFKTHPVDWFSCFSVGLLFVFTAVNFSQVFTILERKPDRLNISSSVTVISLRTLYKFLSSLQCSNFRPLASFAIALERTLNSHCEFQPSFSNANFFPSKKILLLPSSLAAE